MVAEMTGMPYASVKRIIKLSEEEVVRYTQPRKRTALAETLDEPVKDHLRATIYNFYKNKQVPTLTQILDKLQTEQFYYHMNKDTLSKCLKSIGFKHKIINKRAAIMETPRLLTWRTEYISKIRKYREEGRNIVYLDETWFDTHDVLSKGWMDNSGKCCLDTPVSRGKRIIILHAGGTTGWVPNGLLLSAKNIQDSSADYHQDMDHKLFEQWFKNKLLTNIPRGSVIVMDNASYHSKQENKIPTNSSRKSDIIEFLEKNNLSYSQKNTKKILLQLIADSEMDKSKQFQVDNLAKEQGCEVLRLPPYYCVLNPIELIWSQLKHNVRKSNSTPNLGSSVVNLIRRKCDKINANIWQNCVEHVINVENSFLSKRPFPEIIINVNDESDSEEEGESN
jgi:transposase